MSNFFGAAFGEGLAGFSNQMGSHIQANAAISAKNEADVSARIATANESYNTMLKADFDAQFTAADAYAKSLFSDPNATEDDFKSYYDSLGRDLKSGIYGNKSRDLIEKIKLYAQESKSSTITSSNGLKYTLGSEEQKELRKQGLDLFERYNQAATTAGGTIDQGGWSRTATPSNTNISVKNYNNTKEAGTESLEGNPIDLGGNINNIDFLNPNSWSMLSESGKGLLASIELDVTGDPADRFQQIKNSVESGKFNNNLEKYISTFEKKDPARADQLRNLGKEIVKISKYDDIKGNRQAATNVNQLFNFLVDPDKLAQMKAVSGGSAGESKTFADIMKNKNVFNESLAKGVSILDGLDRVDKDSTVSNRNSKAKQIQMLYALADAADLVEADVFESMKPQDAVKTSNAFEEFFGIRTYDIPKATKGIQRKNQDRINTIVDAILGPKANRVDMPIQDLIKNLIGSLPKIPKATKSKKSKSVGDRKVVKKQDLTEVKKDSSSNNKPETQNVSSKNQNKVLKALDKNVALPKLNSKDKDVLMDFLKKNSNVENSNVSSKERNGFRKLPPKPSKEAMEAADEALSKTLNKLNMTFNNESMVNLFNNLELTNDPIYREGNLEGRSKLIELISRLSKTR